MAKETNKDKVLKMQEEAKRIKQDYLKEVFSGQIPTGLVYEVNYLGSSGAKIKEMEIKDVYYSTGNYPTKEFKRCTKEIIEGWEKELDLLKEPKIENIIISYQYNNGKTHSAFRYSEYGKRYSCNKDDLTQEVERYNSIYIAKEGQFNCSYCSKAADNDKKVIKLIYSRPKNYTGHFCSGQCAMHAQMGAEG